jgi:microcystin-dependent protein
MPVNNTTTAATGIATGTGWTFDVTSCNLDPSPGVKDFRVVFGTGLTAVIQSNVLFLKTSGTSIQYIGVSIPAATPVTVIRITPVVRVSELIGYGSRISTLNYENELNRVHRIEHENQARLLSLEQGGGIAGSPVSDNPYDPSWDGSTLTAPSRNAVYDKIEAMFPAGMLQPFARLTLPSGWLGCYGQAVSRTTYSRLFAAIGVNWGFGDGVTTFNVPDLRGQVLAGDGFTIPLDTAGADTKAVPLLQHSHGITATPTSFVYYTPTAPFFDITTGSSTNDAGNATYTPPTTTQNTGTAAATLDVRQSTRYIIYGVSTGGQ